jgi:hypothetical protein
MAAVPPPAGPNLAAPPVIVVIHRGEQGVNPLAFNQSDDMKY